MKRLTFATLMEANLPEIYLNGIRILEPMTAVTNVLVSVTAWVIARQLVKKLPGNAVAKDWAAFFTWTGIGTFLGAIAHGSGVDWFRIVAWTLSGIGLFYVQRSLARWFVRPKVAERFVNWAKLQLVLYIVANLVVGIYFVVAQTIPITSIFFITMVNMGIGLLFCVGGVHLAQYIKSKETGHRWIFSSLMLLLSSALVHVFKLGIHVHFNHKDLGHVMMAATIVGLGMGVLKLFEQEQLG